MERPLIIFVFFIFQFCNFLRPVSCYITWIEPRFPLKGTPSAPGSPWPYPRTWNQSTELLTLDPKRFSMTSKAMECEIVSLALRRYHPLIFHENWEPAKDLGVIHKMEVQVEKFEGKEHCGYPDMEEDESYILDVGMTSGDEAKIRANTVWGALRGLETFSQLVYEDTESKSYRIKKTYIEDKPAFAYRGFLLDTARHFQTMKVIKQHLEAMSYNKFNVFHWHIVDDQSFPYQSETYPNLTTMGAYTQKHVYTQSDVKEIIEYARMRGIRVLPEFDTPGHTRGFGAAFPNLLTECYGEGPDKPLTPNYNEHSERENLDPRLNTTYEFFETFFTEIKGVFPDKYIHLGMDEVYKGCWESSPLIKDFMKENGWTKISQVEQYYVSRTVENVKKIGYKYMAWQDPIDEGVEFEEGSVIEVWKDTSLDSKLGAWQDYIKNIGKSKKKYKMVLAACWYLNYINYGPSWRDYYLCDPTNFEGSDEVKSRVIGGEATMWGEYADATNIIPRIWPFASAVAERLWTNPPGSPNATDDAMYRLDEQRCRMLRRGIPAQPILNGFCGEWELDEPTCPSQGFGLHDSSTPFLYLFCLFICILLNLFQK